MKIVFTISTLALLCSSAFAAPKKGCSQRGGGACPQGDFSHGQTISCTLGNPGGPSYKCNDGQWDLAIAPNGGVGSGSTSTGTKKIQTVAPTIKR
jgi:hypothetical protein